MNTVQEREFFRAEDGQMLAVAGWGGEILYNPGGDKFFELLRSGFGGNSEEYDLSFEDPHHERKGKFHRAGDTIELEGVTFRKSDGPENIEVVPLPTVRRPEYLFRLADGNFLFVSADKYRFSYTSFRMWIGNGEEMKEIGVRYVGRYRDGGTTIIQTDSGNFFSPTPFDTEKKATWNDEEMTRLKIEDFVIVENDNDVTVRPRR